MVEKKLRFWYEKDEKKRKRTPKISPKVVIKGKVGKQESSERLVDHSFEYYINSVNVCVPGTEKKKSPPRLVDEAVIPPTELIKQGVDFLNMSFDEYLKHTTVEASKATEGANVEKTAETGGAGEGIKETFVEGLVHTESSETEIDEFDPTKIAPTSYVSGKQKMKRSLKKKKASDEEDATYVPTPKEKKKMIKKRKAHPTGVVPRSVRARKDTSSTPQKESKAPESPEYERVKKVDARDEEVEVEFMGERKSTPPPPPSPKNPTIHISPGHQKTPEQQQKKVEDPSSAKKATTSSSSHGFPKVSGEHPEDLPSGDFDVFNDGKINVLTKKVSVLEKAKAKAEAEREKAKE
ncbi:hypothetical protein HanRHA438_Chr15g0725801 [Helianthus annuus]|uniref:Uncharacterized protein n=1 Tax=Helianthus annuus TaxID=4232 RepID=A0A9K3E3N4_HELAN|nr:hypothetical protein HanXRQr2_Chr15g0713461 [Helianthus annuus]KAJ0452695.1 hypothetical protein HanHA300_Chr15g0581861 [Helianthus annuus]KAJ0457667.1 hypothetical protein HanIR_Chr15g0776331 [Helianthus annuus]KAJ0474605.1 hypothetical protein HanHA89_Chr15g0631611 [Helianthus annuus]KAJ0650162.1 hypothetical protein HanLR1_Chr15g0592531 [Helianthus annuus]